MQLWGPVVDGELSSVGPGSRSSPSAADSQTVAYWKLEGKREIGLGLAPGTRKAYQRVIHLFEEFRRGMYYPVSW